MKKHITIIALAMIAIAAAFTGCKKNENNNNGNNDEPVVEKKEYKIHYAVDTQYPKADSIIEFTPCFKANITYLEANGDTTKLTDVTLPWEKEITVEGPFKAYIKGNEYYDQSELPETVTYGFYAGFTYQQLPDGMINIKMRGYCGVAAKDNFLSQIDRIQNTLKFESQESLAGK